MEAIRETFATRPTDRGTRSRRGRLKIFFGYGPAAARTRAMLQAATALSGRGMDVASAVGPGRGVCQDGLDLLPMGRSRGGRDGFDIDMALRRTPELLVLGDLAEPDSEENRHLHRYQDVEELLEAGIDVFATLGVERVESMKDIVGRVSGGEPGGGIPDRVLEQADDIVMVDSPAGVSSDGTPRERESTRENELPFEPRSSEARFAQLALRELSLRFLADHFNLRIDQDRGGDGSAAVASTQERLLVCVGSSPTSAKLIRSTRRMASMLRAEWTALTVETPSDSGIPPMDRERISNHQRLAQSLGGEVVTLSAGDRAEEIVRFARSRRVTKIIVGKPVRGWWRERFSRSMVDEVVARSGDIDVYVIRGEGAPSEESPLARTLSRQRWRDYRYPILEVAACTAAAWLMHPYFALSDLIMVYLVGVLLAARRGKRGPAVLACVLSVLAFDFLFVPPRFTVAVEHFSYLVTFAVMLATALAISTLTVRVNRQAETARVAALRTSIQHKLSGHLLGARDPESLLRASVRSISEATESEVAVLLPQGGGIVGLAASHPCRANLSAGELEAAQWVFEHGRPAGNGTDTLCSSAFLHLPLRGRGGPVGVLAVEPGARKPTTEFVRLLESLASQVGLALDVESLRRQQRQILVQVEGERLRNSILSSVSHDLRTPLATIIGSSDSLIDSWDDIESATRRALVRDIHSEAERLSHLITNLLEMTKLEGGALEIRREPQPLEEVVGSALLALGKRLDERGIEVDLADDLPLVDIDGVLIQQVLVNLVGNSLNHSPLDQPIRISARREGEMVRVDVADRGVGLSPAETERVFEKFYRGRNAVAAQGSGLGLAICKGFVESHGGAISAACRPGGGALFSFSIPVFRPRVGAEPFCDPAVIPAPLATMEEG